MLQGKMIKMPVRNYMFLIPDGTSLCCLCKNNALLSNASFLTTVVVKSSYVILCSAEFVPDHVVNPQHKDTTRTVSPL